jgi:hypothetical protein
MAIAPKTYAASVGDDWKQYAAGAADLIADSPTGRCARRIVLLAAGDLSPCVNAAGTNKPMTGLPANYIHDAHVQSCTGSVAFIAYW